MRSGRSLCGKLARRDSLVFTNPVPRLHVVRMSILGESRSFSLFGREEEALLALGNLVEPFCHYSYALSS